MTSVSTGLIYDSKFETKRLSEPKTRNKSLELKIKRQKRRTRALLYHLHNVSLPVYHLLPSTSLFVEAMRRTNTGDGQHEGACGHRLAGRAIGLRPAVAAAFLQHGIQLMQGPGEFNPR